MEWLSFLETDSDLDIFRKIFTAEAITVDSFSDIDKNFGPNLLKRCSKCKVVLNFTDKKCLVCETPTEEELDEAINMLPGISTNLGISLLSKDNAMAKKNYPVNMYLDLISIKEKGSLAPKGIIIRKSDTGEEIGFLFTAPDENDKKYYYPALALKLSGFSGSLLVNLISIYGYDVDEDISKLDYGQYRIDERGLTKTKQIKSGIV